MGEECSSEGWERSAAVRMGEECSSEGWGRSAAVRDGGVQQ